MELASQLSQGRTRAWHRYVVPRHGTGLAERRGGLGAMIIAASLAFMWSGTWPGWAGWVGVVAGILSLASIAFFPQFLFLLWILVVSIWMFLRSKSPSRMAPVP